MTKIENDHFADDYSRNMHELFKKMDEQKDVEWRASIEEAEATASPDKEKFDMDKLCQLHEFWNDISQRPIEITENYMLDLKWQYYIWCPDYHPEVKTMREFADYLTVVEEKRDM